MFSVGQRGREKEGGFGARGPSLVGEQTLWSSLQQISSCSQIPHPALLCWHCPFPLLCYAAIWVNIHF